MGSSSSAVFSGQSSFSADFQQVLTRAVAIASLPMQAMQNAEAKLLAQQQAINGLQSNFSSLQNAFAAVATNSSGTVTAQSSQGSAVVATTTAGALSGTYSIEVDSIGSSTATISKAGTPVTDPSSGNISAATSFKLTVNGTDHTITPSGTSLSSLVSAINAAGDGVQATIVNLG